MERIDADLEHEEQKKDTGDLKEPFHVDEMTEASPGPREIDEVLYQHPAVAAAATIGVPDPLYGEEVAAFIVLKDGMKVSEEDLIVHCQKELADYECPKTIRIVAEIPKGPTGKLLKRELARLYSTTPT